MVHANENWSLRSKEHNVKLNNANDLRQRHRWVGRMEAEREMFSPWTYCPRKADSFWGHIDTTVGKTLTEKVWGSQCKMLGWNISGKTLRHRKKFTEESKTNTVWPHLHVECEKQTKEQMEQNRKTDSDTENKLVAARGEVGTGRMKRYKLSSIKGVSHRDVTYCMGNIVNNIQWLCLVTDGY